MATIQGQLNTPRDTTIQATNTALGLLGKDASLQDIKAALLQIVAALDPTADDYDDLSNKPQVNGVTLSGNKTSKQLGIRQTIPLTSAQYAQLTSAEKMDVDKDYIITDANATAAPINDDSVSRNSVWSSYKVDEELDTLNSAIANVITNLAGKLSVKQMSYDNTGATCKFRHRTNVFTRYPIIILATSQLNTVGVGVFVANTMLSDSPVTAITTYGSCTKTINGEYVEYTVYMGGSAWGTVLVISVDTIIDALESIN